MFLQHDDVAKKIIVEPELAGSKRFGEVLDGFVFEYVTDAETFDGGVLFPEVTVERGWRVISEGMSWMLSSVVSTMEPSAL
jgi:hypothetical protein